MRFKARLSADAVPCLSGIISSFIRISNFGVMILSPDAFKLSLLNELPETPKAYCELSAEVFDEFRIESQADDVILFEIGLDFVTKAFISCLQSASHAAIELKLVKRDGRPCLNIGTKVAAMEISHDIPIKLLAVTDLFSYSSPDVPPPEVSLEVSTPAKILKTIVDRVAKINKSIYITASTDGKLVIQSEDTNAVIKTFLNNLPVQNSGTIESKEEDIVSVMIKVDSRKLSNVLHWQSLVMQSAVLHVSNDEALLIHIQLKSNMGDILFFVNTLHMEETH
jgi:hypothetical protein